MDLLSSREGGKRKNTPDPVSGEKEGTWVQGGNEKRKKTFPTREGQSGKKV